jgi:two-component system, sensor histidine kinase RegB
LLNNAAQASPEAVSVSARIEAGRLCIEVADRGAGLASGKPAGWGVGLELARATLQRVGGDLAIDATAEGGVTASVLLPLARERSG